MDLNADHYPTALSLKGNEAMDGGAPEARVSQTCWLQLEYSYYQDYTLVPISSVDASDRNDACPAGTPIHWLKSLGVKQQNS